jgi:hypothetical protein
MLNLSTGSIRVVAALIESMLHKADLSPLVQSGSMSWYVTTELGDQY